MDDIVALLNDINRIPSLPDIYYRVTEKIKDPTASAGEMGKIIEKDQAFTMKLLKLANSSFVGFPGPVETVTRAIAIIGFNQLRDMVLTHWLREHFCDQGTEGPVPTKAFWRHSLSCGIACKTIAFYVESHRMETYFVAGFIHDLGRLLLQDNFCQKYREIYETSKKGNRLLFEIEQDVLGFTHADVGGALLKTWQLPPALVDAVTNHHQPEKATCDRRLVAAVHFADIIIQALEIGYSGNSFIPKLHPEAVQVLGIKPSALQSIADRIQTQYSDAVDILLN